MAAAGEADTKNSVDAAEIARFDRLAAQWWSPDGPMHALHKMNPVRVRWLRDRMAAHFSAPNQSRANAGPQMLAGLTVLDIGCGGGILSESLARHGASVTGLEPAEKNLAVARAHAQQQGLEIDYRPDTAEAMAAAGHAYDVVCAMEVVEHVADMESFVASACSMVRPGGLFFAATLNRTLKSFALAIVGAEYVLRWVPAGTHQWEKFVKPRELKDAIGAAGLVICDSTGVVYNPLARVWRTSRDMDVNYMLAAKRDS
ncbi:MAG: bifunctional 2-polyprenyl-6-hydroxyphenol methylase/3-demethylubiquinol 3-O-methyltransferase UbiG [Beijerinckiaceae bacterium]